MGDRRNLAGYPPVQAPGAALRPDPGRADHLRPGGPGDSGGHRPHPGGGLGQNRLDEGVEQKIPCSGPIPVPGGRRSLRGGAGADAGGAEKDLRLQ